MILSKQKAPKAEPLECLVGVTLPLVGCVSPEKCLNSLCLCSLIWKMDRIVVPTSGLLMKWCVERAWSPFA